MISSTMMALVDRLAADGRITSDEAIDVRRAIFPDGAVSREEATALFAVNERVGGDDPAWDACFVEAICDHLLNYAPFGHVTDEGATWLLASVTQDGVLEGPTELQLVLKLLEKADSCPRTLHEAARKFVSTAVLTGQGYEGRDPALVPGQIGEAELVLIRRVLFAAGGAGNVAVTREEAEWLFELDAATQGQNHVAGWRDLFVSGVMNHLFAAGPSDLLDRNAMMQRAQWVGSANKGGIGGFLTRVVLGGAAGYADRASQPSPLEGQFGHVNRREREAKIAEALEGHEADWLMQRINADGRRTANEQALVDAVKAAKGEAALKSA